MLHNAQYILMHNQHTLILLYVRDCCLFIPLFRELFEMSDPQSDLEPEWSNILVNLFTVGCTYYGHWQL